MEEEPDLNLVHDDLPVSAVDSVRCCAANPRRGCLRAEREAVEHACNVALSIRAHRRRVTSEEVAQIERDEAEVVIWWARGVSARLQNGETTS